MQGDLRPGDQLPTEQELCSALDVGRSSVREALRVLEAEGLIEVRRGLGAFVAPRSIWSTARNEVARWLEQHEESLVQLLEVRESIEGLTAARAASSVSAETLAELTAIVEQQAAKAADDDATQHIDELADLDIRFHLVIAEASGNDIAGEIVNHIVPAFCEGNKAVLHVGRRADKMVEEHRAILEAIKAGDSAGAERAMRAHITRVRAEIR